MLLGRGFRSLIEEADAKKSRMDLTKEQRAYYEAVSIALNGALVFFKRYGPLLRDMEKDASPKRQAELEAMAAMADTAAGKDRSNRFGKVARRCTWCICCK